MNIKVLSEKVHNAYLDTCKRLGWGVKFANQVPYVELIEDSKEPDRASVRAVASAVGFKEENGYFVQQTNSAIAVSKEQVIEFATWWYGPNSKGKNTETGFDIWWAQQHH